MVANDGAGDSAGHTDDPSTDLDTEDQSPFTRVRELLTAGDDLSFAEVADRCGVPRAVLAEVFEALGRAERDRYGQRDVAYAQTIANMLDLYPLDTVIRSLRVRNRAVTSVVVNDLTAVRDHVIQPALEDGAGVDELAEMLGETAETILPIAADSLANDYRDILRRLLDLDVVATAATESTDGGVVVAIGFVDVVGYTALSARVDPSGLDDVLAAFEDLVVEQVADHDDVMLTKFIGDAAMLLSEDVASLAHTLYDIVTAKKELSGAPRSAGMAAGGVLVREGDYVGPPVNLAARLTDHARSDSLLADDDLYDDLEHDFELTRIPETEIHGVGKRRPLRVRRNGSSEDDEDD